ncbi:hypothetical protein CYANOKiyG1_14890 [Okeania sp. KiyG1]|nr:hypothetical protein CYANOKiyG1_14890 [Okeania sp. KiyG1]
MIAAAASAATAAATSIWVNDNIPSQSLEQEFTTSAGEKLIKSTVSAAESIAINNILNQSSEKN